MSETLFRLLMIIAGVGCLWLGWHLRGEHDRPDVTTKPPTSHVTRPSHHIDVKAVPYKIERPQAGIRLLNAECRDVLATMDPAETHRAVMDRPYGIENMESRWWTEESLVQLRQEQEPIDIHQTVLRIARDSRGAANKRNRERILANMRAGKRNN